MKIAVAGTGYVGLSIATLLAQKHTVVAVDVIPEKVEKINRKVSPIADEYLERYLAEKPLDLVATLDGRAAYRDADFVVIAAPTNYDPKKNFFDTSHVEEVINLVLEVNPDAVMVIKSTVIRSPHGRSSRTANGWRTALSASSPRRSFSPRNSSGNPRLCTITCILPGSLSDMTPQRRRPRKPLPPLSRKAR